jgi:hypothetical protein
VQDRLPSTTSRNPWRRRAQVSPQVGWQGHDPCGFHARLHYGNVHAPDQQRWTRCDDVQLQPGPAMRLRYSGRLDLVYGGKPASHIEANRAVRQCFSWWPRPHIITASKSPASFRRIINARSREAFPHTRAYAASVLRVSPSSSSARPRLHQRCAGHHRSTPSVYKYKMF